jgi:7,8-dihydropterin-6-yl-methyl-4-(beta-D-ribofuranosyl)aminobenzene 5'-phosphate synthase
MTDTLNIVVLVENSVHTGGLRAEHGLSWLLETGPHRVLFDTGQTDIFLENAASLNTPLSGLDAIALSHGHYDHTGGLASACRVSPGVPVFLHPDALQPKFTANADGSSRFIGMPEASRRALAENPGRIVLTSGCRELVPGLFVTGVIPRETGFEDVGGRFFLDPNLRLPDSLADDQAVFAPTREGTVVVLGCAHAGIINTLRHIQRLTGDARFRAILGGLHLINASEARLDATIRALATMDISLLMPAHCTGLPATVRLWESLRGRCTGLGVGSRFSFDRMRRNG